HPEHAGRHGDRAGLPHGRPGTRHRRDDLPLHARYRDGLDAARRSAHGPARRGSAGGRGPAARRGDRVRAHLLGPGLGPRPAGARRPDGLADGRGGDRPEGPGSVAAVEPDDARAPEAMNIPLVESPFFTSAFPPGQSDPELLRVARSLHDDGFAVIDFPDDDFDARVAAIRGNLQRRYDWEAWRSGRSQGLRIQDAWTFDRNVQQIAVNARVVELLSRLYGKPAFPFQTLNFPVGTEQHFHTDSVHFSSIPERFMCGVWVAFEDVSPEAGPL